MISGSFESHVTVSVPPPGDMERLRDFAERQGMKFTLIELSSGLVSTQPMLTRHAPGGLLEEELETLRAVADQLRATGFDVVRVKVEVDAENHAAPVSDTLAAAAPDGCYFEQHVKLLLPSAPPAALHEVCAAHEAKVSRNARRIRPDGRQEWFLTKRCYQVPRSVAQRSLAALLETLSRHPWTVLEVEDEYVVHDSHAALDAGWMDITAVKSASEPATRLSHA